MHLEDFPISALYSSPPKAHAQIARTRARRVSYWLIDEAVRPANHRHGAAPPEEAHPYRALGQEFELDDAGLEALRFELVQVEQIALDQDGEILVWAGEDTATLERSSAPARLVARSATVLPPIRGTSGPLASLPCPPSGVAPQEALPAVEPPGLGSVVSDAERRPLTVMFCDLADFDRALEPARPRGSAGRNPGVSGALHGHNPRVRGLRRQVHGRRHPGLFRLSQVFGEERRAGDPGRARDRRGDGGPQPHARGPKGDRDRGPYRDRDRPRDGRRDRRRGARAGAHRNRRGAERRCPAAGPRRAQRHRDRRADQGDRERRLRLRGDLGAHELKGIAGLVKTFAVVGLRAEMAEGDADDEAVAGAPTLVGRDEEIGLLRRAWQRPRTSAAVRSC